jgi:hypothetical protein
MARSRRNSLLSSEHLEQSYFVAWFRQNYPDFWIFAIPNGGMREKMIAAKLKTEGVSSGVPDLYIPALKIWIEMKSATGKLSPVQKQWIEYLRNLGDTVLVAYGNLAAQEMIREEIEKIIKNS